MTGMRWIETTSIICCQKIFRRTQKWPEWGSVKHRLYFLSRNIQEKANMTRMKLIEETSIFFSGNIQENAKMTGMMFNKAPFIFVVKKYSGESKNDRNEVDWSKIHCFSVNIQEHAKMTGMMFMMKHCPYFLQANIQEKAKMTGMKLRKWLKQHPYFLSENIQENAKMTGIMFNEPSFCQKIFMRK